jgi:hypothetical protein
MLGHWGEWFWRRIDDRMPSAAKFHLFQPLDGFALISDDLHQTSAMDMKLMVITQKMRTRPILDS